MKKKEIIAAQKLKIEALEIGLEACSKALEKSINDNLKLIKTLDAKNQIIMHHEDSLERLRSLNTTGNRSL